MAPVEFDVLLSLFGVLQVVIMLVIDKENDRALLSRQSRFVPRMWSCLAGFIEVQISS
jgi:NADH pyrophosphatase NudC (nudix superfamily)